MSPSPAETFPPELWQHVLDHLYPKDIKNARYAYPGLQVQGCRALFHTITIGPTIHYLERLRNIVGHIHNGTGLVNYVKIVSFELCPLWRGDWDFNLEREKEQETKGMALDYIANFSTENPWSELFHFAVPEFGEALKLLVNVQEIRILSTSNLFMNRYGYTLRRYDPQPMFFQLLSLCRSLPKQVQTFKMLSGIVVQMALSIFNGSRLDSRTFRPKLGMSHPPLSLASVLQDELEYGLGIFTGIKVLEIHLYDQIYKRYRAGPALGLFDLKNALLVMASTLQDLSLTVSTPGEDSWQFTRCCCVSHRGTLRRLSFNDIFSGIKFESLKNVYLCNIEYLPRHVGEFLRKYASTLDRLHIAQWHCELYLPSLDDLRLLRNTAGSALFLLTLESCENEHMELCKAMTPADCSKKFYWCLNAVKLAELMLDLGLSHDQMCLAVRHRVKLLFNSYLDLPYAYTIEGVAYQHTQCKLLEQPAYRNAMLNTPADILAERAMTMEAQVLAYYQATRPRDFVNGQLTRPMWTLYMYLQEDLSVFEVNGVPGLYMYMAKCFWHFDKEFEGRELYLPYWRRDLESEFLTNMGADQVKEVELDLGSSWHFRRKTPDAPNFWKMPYSVEISDLEAKPERVRKKEAWAVREATRKISKKSKKHWAWVASRGTERS